MWTENAADAVAATAVLNSIAVSRCMLGAVSEVVRYVVSVTSQARTVFVAAG